MNAPLAFFSYDYLVSAGVLLRKRKDRSLQESLMAVKTKKQPFMDCFLAIVFVRIIWNLRRVFSKRT